MNRIETSELIEMPFGVCAHGGPTNRVLGGGPVLPVRKMALLGSAFFVKEYFPVPSSGGNQCKNRHAPIWHFG